MSISAWPSTCRGKPQAQLGGRSRDFPAAPCSKSLDFTLLRILMHNRPDSASFSGSPRPHQSPRRQMHSVPLIPPRREQRGLRNFLKDASSNFWHLLFRLSNCRCCSEFWYVSGRSRGQGLWIPSSEQQKQLLLVEESITLTVIIKVLSRVLWLNWFLL